jgi:hypothetical protein
VGRCRVGTTVKVGLCKVSTRAGCIYGMRLWEGEWWIRSGIESVGGGKAGGARASMGSRGGVHRWVYGCVLCR